MVSLGDPEPTKGLDVGVMGVGFVTLRLLLLQTLSPNPHPATLPMREAFNRRHPELHRILGLSVVQ